MSPNLPSSLLQMLRPASPECYDKSTSDRHFVTWTDQDDEILRQAVSKYGTDKWSVIAAQFHNKTGRQCRRRWHTYLSTDCKKGGWSPEEDQLLLEAHRKYGNRWTEIAKVVPGRTDNAVKNRFSALGKKEAKKMDAMTSASCSDLGGKTLQKRKILEQNSNIINKRPKGGSTQSQINSLQMKKLPQNWVIDQRLAHRAHPVHNDKPLYLAARQQLDKPLQELKGLNGQKIRNVAHRPPIGSSTITSGSGAGKFPISRGSFSENISPPRLAALNQNAALLDSLVERRDAMMKQWDSSEGPWKSFSWLTADIGRNTLQMGSFPPQTVLLFDELKESFCENKENNLDFSQVSFQSPFTPTVLMGQESSQAKQPDLGALTPTVQHERSWKVRPENESLDSSSSSNAGSNQQAGDSSPTQNECLSSGQVDQHNEGFVAQVDQPAPMVEENELISVEGAKGLRRGHMNDERESQVVSSSFADVSSPFNMTPDSLFFLDGMPSPHFSDSEKQFLLSAFDLSDQHSALEFPFWAT